MSFVEHGGQEDSVESMEELRKRLEAAEREKLELKSNLDLVVKRNQEMLERPANRQAYQRDLCHKFTAFVQNRLRFHRALERVCAECKSTRKQANVMSAGVATVGLLASIQRTAQYLGSFVSVGAIALNTYIGWKSDRDEAECIRQLRILEETDLKMVGILLNAYDEFCVTFKIPKEIGDEDMMRLHLDTVCSSMISFVDGYNTGDLSSTPVALPDLERLLKYGFENAILPVLAHIGNSNVPELLNLYSTLSDAASLTVSGAESANDILKAICGLVHGFCVVNALFDLWNGSESDAIKRMRSFIEQQKHELELFQSAVEAVN
ncbi:unnamed protein product [Anisakis simplex]|uniref:Uncharacterized protein n=1 Tax=Anisakis simplex TaxID=6269 RepID=A0A0M3JUQ5_ANISI|nr:unnamed protein product [Anisakis simplex]